jgi:hypothetical protein
VTGASGRSPRGRGGLSAFARLRVGAPLVHGLYELVRKVPGLFTG